MFGFICSTNRGKMMAASSNGTSPLKVPFVCHSAWWHSTHSTELTITPCRRGDVKSESEPARIRRRKMGKARHADLHRYVRAVVTCARALGGGGSGDDDGSPVAAPSPLMLPPCSEVLVVVSHQACDEVGFLAGPRQQKRRVHLLQPRFCAAFQSNELQQFHAIQAGEAFDPRRPALLLQVLDAEGLELGGGRRII